LKVEARTGVGGTKEEMNAAAVAKNLAAKTGNRQ
jgi:hypothetical protein